MNIEEKKKVSRFLKRKYFVGVVWTLSNIKEIIKIVKSDMPLCVKKLKTIRKMIDNGLPNIYLRLKRLSEIGSSNMCLENFILRYGDVLGREKYESSSYLKGKSFRDSNIQRENALKFSRKRREKPENYYESTNTRIEYYTARGYSVDDAIKKLSERQNTFNLKKCIEKHGDIKGTDIWRDRQEKWQASLQSKPADELKKINDSKGSTSGYGISLLRKYEQMRNTPAEVYFMRFFNDDFEFWKIGITKNKISNRFGVNDTCFKNNNLHYEIIDTLKGSWLECYIIEQSILKEMEKFRCRIEYNKFKSTECFTIKIFDAIMVDNTIYEETKNHIMGLID